MLTPEDRQRIEEEEQYRALVQTRMASRAHIADSRAQAEKDRRLGYRVLLLLIIFIVVLGFSITWSPRYGAPLSFGGNSQSAGVLPALGNAIQTRVSVYSQNQAHPTCSGILGYGHVAQSFCDGITGARTITMPNQ